MSLYVDLHINNELIAGVAITRVTNDEGEPEQVHDDDTVNRYRWDHHTPEGIMSGEVEHRYSEGAITLAQKTFAAIAEELSKKEQK